MKCSVASEEYGFRSVNIQYPTHYSYIFSLLSNIDPDLLAHLAQNGADAISLTIQECDNQDCILVDGWKASDGWHFSEGLGDRDGTTQKIIMMAMNDTE